MLQTYKLFFNISTFFPIFVLYRRVINTIVGMRNIIIADNQDITRAGITYLLSQIEGCSCQMVTDKSGLIAQLKEQPESVIIVDYTLFDFVGENDLQIITLRFHVHTSFFGVKILALSSFKALLTWIIR